MPTSTASPPAMSTTGIGFKATAAPVARAKFQIRRLAASSRMRTLRATISACRSPAIRSVLRATRALPSRSSTSRMRILSGSINGRRAFPLDLRGAVGELDLDLVGVGPGRRHHDVFGADRGA